MYVSDDRDPPGRIRPFRGRSESITSVTMASIFAVSIQVQQPAAGDAARGTRPCNDPGEARLVTVERDRRGALPGRQLDGCFPNPGCATGDESDTTRKGNGIHATRQRVRTAGLRSGEKSLVSLAPA